MSFPVNPQGYPNPMGTGAFANPFMSVDFSSMPGALPSQVPMTMGVPGFLPGSMPAATNVPLAIDPMTGMPFGQNAGSFPMGSSFLGFDPFSGMSSNNSFGSLSMPFPPAITPMTGVSLGTGGIDPMTGMPLSTGMIDPMTGMPLSTGMIDPMTGMPVGALPMGMSMPMAPPCLPGQSMAPQQPEESPIKQMFKMLMQMKLFQMLMNKQGAEEESTASEETITEVSDNATALDIISDKNNFSKIAGSDGNISFLDISRAARTSTNEEVKAAATYIKENVELFKQLEKLSHPGDGVFTEEDIGNALQKDSIMQGSSDSGEDTLYGGEGNDGYEEGSEDIADDATALDVFANRFDDLDENANGQVTVSELSSAASDSDDPQLQALAKYLRTKGLFSEVDDLDEKSGVSLEDINDAMQDPNIVEVEDGEAPVPIDTAGMTEEQAITVINRDFATIDALKDPKDRNRTGLSDSKLSKEDLDAIINSKDDSVTEEMKKAAQVMKDKDLINTMDKLEENKTDGLLLKDTLQKWVDDYEGSKSKTNAPKDFKEAMTILNRAGAGNIFGDAEKKSFTFREVQEAVNKTDLAPDVKGALQYLIDHKDQFDKLDSLDLSDDDKVQMDVLADAALDGESISYFEGEPDEEKNNKALSIFGELFDEIDVAGDKKDVDTVISDEDVEAVLADHTGKYTAEQKAALKYLFTKEQGPDNTTLWGALSAGEHDLTKEEFNAAVSGSESVKPEDIKWGSLYHLN